uniref:protein-disulfide reductase n=1 Tax=Meloidogyne hapla TaxID=6305 RepID=A0A1I8B0U3_MELHA
MFLNRIYFQKSLNLFLNIKTLTVKNFAYLSTGHEHFLSFVPELRVGIENDGKTKINFEELNKKVLIIYFSAGWCATCKGFTPILKKFYNQSKDDLAILWISRDKSASDQIEYYKKSLDPEWMYLPFGKSNRDFLKLYKLAGLPSVKLVSNDGKFIEEVKMQIEKNADNPKELIQLLKSKANN